MRYVAGPALLLIGGQLSTLVVKVPALVVGFVLVTGANLWADQALKAAQQQLRQEDARRSLTILLQNMVTMIEAASPGNRSLRANVMLYDSNDHGLRIAYSTGGYDAEEKSILWRPGQGCAGQAWETAKTVVAPEDHELPVAVGAALQTSRPWNMTQAQIRFTAERIACVVSVPVPHPDDRSRVIGILNLDDSRPLTESLIGSPDVKAAVEEVATDVAVLLTKGESRFSGSDVTPSWFNP